MVEDAIATCQGESNAHARGRRGGGGEEGEGDGCLLSFSLVPFI